MKADTDVAGTSDDPSMERGHQIMDWPAAVVAGLVSGSITLLIVLIGYPLATGGTPWTVFRYIAAIVLDQRILPPPTSFDAMAFLAGLAIHLALSVFYTVILALVIHRWGIAVGIVGGALFGVALFLINLFTLTRLFEWFHPLRSWSFLLLHAIFGAVAGGLYELLERDYYVENVADEWT